MQKDNTVDSNHNNHLPATSQIDGYLRTSINLIHFGRRIVTKAFYSSLNHSGSRSSTSPL